ncbi:MAG: RusA family crossover junction endodeoxyribonuclease [Gemmatimonadota bacterium]|nr:MAG: RusA family crossover junction endodeoxyribonuclease [Gemmatimonadota bacterium]
MKLIGEFFHPGRPKGKGRPRFGAGGHAFTPAQTRLAEDSLGYSALQARPDKPTDKPLFVGIVFRHPVPKSWPKWKRELCEQGMVYQTSTPDLDNQVKLVLDALNHAGWWDDDKQISWLQACAVHGDKPGVHVRVAELPSPDDQRHRGPID